MPLILAVHYPGDEEVYHMIWDLFADSGSANAALVALNAGRFKTSEADRLRMESLASDEISTFAMAAQGIGMSKPEGGLEALVSALKTNPISVGVSTKLAILAYGDAALPVLREALEASDLSDAAANVVAGGIERLRQVR